MSYLGEVPEGRWGQNDEVLKDLHTVVEKIRKQISYTWKISASKKAKIKNLNTGGDGKRYLIQFDKNNTPVAYQAAPFLIR